MRKTTTISGKVNVQKKVWHRVHVRPSLWDCRYYRPLLPFLIMIASFLACACISVFAVKDDPLGLSLVCIGTSFIIFSDWYRSAQRWTVLQRPPSRCFSCGYSRTGLPDDVICPECGEKPLDEHELASLGARM